MTTDTRKRQVGHARKGKIRQRRYDLFQALLHLPPHAWRMLEIAVLVVLTNHTAITDLIQLLKLMR